jgi:mRNA interferase RelE/StbE
LEDVDLNWEIRRIRIDTWRVIYAINEELEQVAILAIRRRPPYDYEDLPALLASLE